MSIVVRLVHARSFDLGRRPHLGVPELNYRCASSLFSAGRWGSAVGGVWVRRNLVARAGPGNGQNRDFLAVRQGVGEGRLTTW